MLDGDDSLDGEAYQGRHEPIRPPEDLPAFPNAKRVDQKALYKEGVLKDLAGKMANTYTNSTGDIILLRSILGMVKSI